MKLTQLLLTLAATLALITPAFAQADKPLLHDNAADVFLPVAADKERSGAVEAKLALHDRALKTDLVMQHGHMLVLRDFHHVEHTGGGSPAAFGDAPHGIERFRKARLGDDGQSVFVQERLVRLREDGHRKGETEEGSKCA